MPFPMTPAQAAILGKTRPAPAATVNAAGAVPSARPPTGQTPVPVATPAAAGLGFSPNNMDEFLLGRANRNEPIRGGVGLLGRLAALGVGNKIQKSNREGQQEAIEQAISFLPPEMQNAARIAALGGDPKAILPIIQQQAAIAAQSAAREDSQAHQAEQQEKRLTASAEENALTREQRAIQQEATNAIQTRSVAVQEANAAINQRRLELAAQEAAQPDFKEANELRDDFRNESKVFKDQSAAMARIQASAEDPSPAGDLALIFNYMKMLDPGSTVREGEFANASNSGSVPERIRGLYNQVTEGTRLSDTQRVDFVDRSGKIFKGARNQHVELENEFRKLGERRGVAEEDFLVDYVGELRDADFNSAPAGDVEAEIKKLEQELGIGSQ